MIPINACAIFYGLIRAKKLQGIQVGYMPPKTKEEKKKTSPSLKKRPSSTPRNLEINELLLLRTPYSNSIDYKQKNALVSV